MKFKVFNEVLFKKEDLVKTLEKLFPFKKEMTINIIFVCEDEMRKLNREFRGEDEITDVISFKLNEKIAEVYICMSYVLENRQDLARMLIHGILHVLGYTHQGYFDEKKVSEKMFKLQERYLKKFYDILEK